MLKLEVERRMLPAAEGRDLESIVQAVLHNIDKFDYVAFANWTRTQPWSARTRKLAVITHPPNRVYRVVSDNERESAGANAPVLLGCVVGYQEGVRGGPPLACVWILGVLEGAGSYADPITVPGESLRDVTDHVRAGKMRTAP